MNAAVFPVGHYGGVRPGDTPDAAPVHVVRIGWTQHRLSEDAFGVWVLAHGVPESGKGWWTAEDIRAKAEQNGIGQVADHLADLAAAGAVAVVEDGPAALGAFVQKYRMQVLFVGLGNSAEEPERHAIGIPGLGTAAVLDLACYELWQWGSVAPALWQTCEVRAKVSTDLGEPREAIDLVGEVVADLRYLVTFGCAYLDLVATT